MARTPINFVCLKWGTKYSAEFVNKLYGMCSRHFEGFKFHLDGDDKGSSTNVRMVKDSVTFQIPSDISGMVHPDLIALTSILCCHPFVGSITLGMTKYCLNFVGQAEPGPHLA